MKLNLVRVNFKKSSIFNGSNTTIDDEQLIQTCPCIGGQYRFEKKN